MFYKEYFHLLRIAVVKRTKMGSKCKFYIVYLYLMGIMIINRSGMGVQMFSKVCLHLVRITIVKRTSTLISDLLLVFINYWRTQMKLLDIHFVSWWLKKNVDYLIHFPDLFIDYWYMYMYIILFFRALEIFQEDAVAELMVKHVILNAIIATKNLHIIHKI